MPTGEYKSPGGIVPQRNVRRRQPELFGHREPAAEPGPLTTALQVLFFTFLGSSDPGPQEFPQAEFSANSATQTADTRLVRLPWTPGRRVNAAYLALSSLVLPPAHSRRLHAMYVSPSRRCFSTVSAPHSRQVPPVGLFDRAYLQSGY